MTDKIGSEYPPIDETENDLCRSLWLAVLTQAAIDCRSQSEKPKQQENKQAAQQWIHSGDEDFDFVCNLAGLDPNHAKAQLTHITEIEPEALDFRCLKKATKENRNRESRSKYLRRTRRRKEQRAAA